ncbi:YciI family protein [Georgenia sp. TF02-10]|uniref:YciI family protein n=1 Tax=Georgenia sp. TF02-10 TaxID=2917725 RepID=UPI001FA7E26A|nr:YciI family protein [Georgenia sp. TF02-10]UNX56177.1 YciI family protein [Georgenia sp. TF02-10]
MPIFAVEYAYDTTRTEDLDKLRPEHREFLAGLHDAGVLVVSGPWLDAAAPGALLMVRAINHDAALEALDPDPFHRAGLITSRTARAWDPVVGKLT